MAAWRRWLPGRCRRILPVAICGTGCAAGVWWSAEGGPPVEAVIVLLGWGLGLLPVHVTLRGPWSGGGKVVRRSGHRSVPEHGRSRGRQRRRPSGRQGREPAA